MVVRTPNFQSIVATILTAAMITFSGPAPAADTIPELGNSAIGNYLAGRFAQSRRDMSAAADFLNAALEEAPEAPDLLRRTFLLMIMEGRMEDALPLARELLEKNPARPIANLVVVVEEMKQGNYKKLDEHAEQLDKSGLNAFTMPVMRAWALAGRKEYDDALTALSPLKGAEGSESLHDLHLAMINDIAGRRDEALKSYETMAAANGTQTLRLTQLLGNLYERLGKKDKARAVYDNYSADHPAAHLFKSAYRRLDRGRKPEPIVRVAAEGAAEALFGLASSLSQQRVRDTATVLGQLALYLKPNFPIMMILAGDLLEADERLEKANEYYSAIDKSSGFSWSARLRVAGNLNQLDRTDEAVSTLKTMAKESPENPQPLIRLGDILRNHERFDEAISAYDDAIQRIGDLEPRHWTLLYTRGMVLERAKAWSRAESDLLRALEFEPDQPHVLNYLGYSWIEQGVHLEKAQEMIRTAVKLRPNDGYIVDSLGWGYYRVGNYDDAVKELERAVELRPEDPVINDHLGDAYWRVGRNLEATFQWKRSLSLDPEPDLIETIQKKLKDGLTDEEASVPAVNQPENASATAN